MPNLKDIIYLSNEDYETLVSTGTVTIDGETLTYDENNVYVTPDKLASSTEDGLMSAADKTKLDGIKSYAEENVQSDWNQTNSSADDYIKNKPAVNNGILTIKKNGIQVATFTANQSSNATANITVPVNLVDLNNRTSDKISEPDYAWNIPTLTFRPYIYDTYGNRMYGLSPNRIIVEESIDAGQSWNVVILTDYQKNQIFDNTNNASLQFLKLNDNNTCNAMIRITCALANFGSAADEASDANKLALWTSENYVANTFYCNCDRFYVYVGGPNYCDCTFQTAPAPASGSAPTFTNKLFIDRARGWNGGNTASCSSPFYLGGNKTQAPIVRFIFRVNSGDGNYDDSKLAQNGTLRLLNIRLLGPTIFGASGSMMQYNTPYKNISGYPNLFEWSGHLRPSLDNAYNLGSTDRKWKDFYLSNSIIFDSDGGYIKVGTSNEIAITNTGTKFDNTVYPWSNNTYDLGTPSIKWKNLYLGSKLYTPEIDYTTGNLIIGNASYYTIIKGDSLLPSANNNRNLGSIDYNWHKLYVNQIFTSNLDSGEGDLILNSTGISFRPELTNSNDLGAPTYKWKNLYLSGNLTDGTNTLNIAQIKAKQDALPTTIMAGKVLKSTSIAGVVEWGDTVDPSSVITDVKIGTTSIVSGNVATIPSADLAHSGIVTTETQTFGGLKIFNDSLKVGTSFGNNDNWIDISTAGISLSRGAYYTDNNPHMLTIRSSERWGDIEEEHWGFKFQNGLSGPFNVAIPNKTGLISLISDFETETSKNQSTSVAVINAITNINGRVFQNYTANLVTSGSYVYYQILKNGNNLTENDAKEYMKYMTGSTFLPTYNYDFPKQTIFIFADRSTWKVQYSSSDGLRLYRLTTSLALESSIKPGTVTSVRVQAGTGLSSSQSTAQTSTLNTTISIANGYKLPTNTQWNTCIKDVSLNGTTLTFTKNDNSIVVIDLPSPSGGQAFSGDPNIY